MKKWIELRSLSALLCALMLIPLLCSCSFLFPQNDLPQEIFDPPYLENYYVNKHTPVAKSGGMAIHKYESSASKTFTLGGNDYHGGIEFWNTAGALSFADIEFPLEGLYKNFSFVLSGNGAEKTFSSNGKGEVIYPSSSFAMEGAYPTLRGTAKELEVGIQILIDGRIQEEFFLSSYDVARRYTYDVTAAQTFEIKVIAGADVFNIFMMEITVWEGEAKETGHIYKPATDVPVKLVRDIKPYLIPNGSTVKYYPNHTSGEYKSIRMNGVEFEDSIATRMSLALMGDKEESVFFDLEGKYKYLTFIAGGADGNSGTDECTAWLTVYADGRNVLEEVVSTHELYRQFTLDITGCRQLKFVWRLKEESEGLGDSGGDTFGIADAYVALTEDALNNIGQTEGAHPDRPVKMISELGVFGVVSQVEQPVFDSSTTLKSFSMGGIKYAEGVVLYAQNSILATKPACAAFNLNGRYSTVSFVVGQISNSDVYENDELEIYADGKLIKTIEIKFHAIPREYAIDVRGCRHLEFVSGKLTSSLTERPAIGIANLTAYPEGYKETSLFPQRTPGNFSDECDLIDELGFYGVYNSHLGDSSGAVSVNRGYYDGAVNKNTFTVAGKILNKGLLLKTNLVDLDTVSVGGASILGTSFGGWGHAPLELDGSGEAHESAFAVANIMNSGYTTVTFTVAMQEELGGVTVQNETTLMIGADDKCVKEITLSRNMKPTTYTVELGEGCERLMFWLDCSIEDKGSHVYAIYNIKLNK